MSQALSVRVPYGGITISADKVLLHVGVAFCQRQSPVAGLAQIVFHLASGLHCTRPSLSRSGWLVRAPLVGGCRQNEAIAVASTLYRLGNCCVLYNERICKGGGWWLVIML